MRRHKLNKGDWTGKKCKQEVRDGKVDKKKVTVSTKVRRTEYCQDGEERTEGRVKDNQNIDDKQHKKLVQGNDKQKNWNGNNCRIQGAFTRIDRLVHCQNSAI